MGMSGNNTIQGINWRSKVSHILLLTAACSALMAGGWCKPHEILAVAITSCTACHGNPPVDGTRAGATGAFLGSHNKHAGTGAGQSALACSVCHVQPAAGNYKHADGFINITGSAVKGNSYLGGKKKPVANVPAFYGCTNVYCHSTVQAVNGTSAGVVDTTPAWGSTGPISCATNCHKNEPATNNHNQHLSTNTAYGYSCATCHAPQTAATHANGTITMVLAGTNAAYKIAGTPYTAVPPATSLAFGSCTTNVCHGQASPAWGTVGNASKCLKCHGQRAGVFATITSANVAPGGTGTDTGGVTGTTVRGGNHQAHLSAPSSISDKMHCGECHVPVNNTVAAIATHLNYTTASMTFGPLAKTAGHNPSVARSGGAIACNNTYCHTGNRQPGTAAGQSGVNTPPVWNNTSLIGGTTIADSCNLKCHAMPPGSTVSGDTHFGIADVGSAALSTTVLTTCSSNAPATGCHPTINAGGTTILGLFFNKLLHINGTVEGGSCVSCHSKTILRTKGRLLGKNVYLSAVSTEFGLAWGHKRGAASTLGARAAVTDEDCIVCHLEGNSATKKTSGFHQDGNIDLRDPKGLTTEAPITNISGTAFTFQRFSTSYAAGSRTSTGHTANTIDNVITQKFCLGCHDSAGATNPGARTTGGTATMPFGGINMGANYSLANGAAAAGGIVNAKAQFATTNSSAHPVLGPRTKDFPTPARLSAPYNGFTRAGTTGTLTAGVVINCFDCHNRPATVGAPLTLRTVVAHGNANTIRGIATVTGTPALSTNQVTFCIVCHTGYAIGGTTSNHGTGSALSASTNNGMVNYLSYACNTCHSSGYSTAVVRPVRAMDVHGVNALPPSGGVTKTVRWAGTSTGTPAQVNARPYAFIRNTQILSDHSPKKIGGSTYSPNCNMANSTPNCSQGMKTYTVGGTY